jgi:formate dehydrogenase alpha subunit
MATITIDGRAIEFTGAPTILDAARAGGIRIPHLCAMRGLLPIGSCRVCVVEVEGATVPMAACTTPATDGARVTTRSDRLTRLRRQALQFVLLHHPLDCPVCDKAGECKLQDLAFELGVSDQPFRAFPAPPQRVDKLSPLIERNDARCIRCGRCLAVCHEVQGVGAYRFTGRGFDARVDTQDGGPLDCEFCGQCVAVCPVGALLSRPFLHAARVWDLTAIDSACGYCGAGCVLQWNVRDKAKVPGTRERVLRVTSVRHGNPVNGGNLCVRGRFAFDVSEHAERIHGPRVREGDRWREATWDEALDRAAAGLRGVVATDGAAALAGIGSARMTTEDAALFSALLDRLGTPHRGSPADFGLRAAQETAKRLTGRAASTATVADLGAADTIVVLGDLAVAMPVPTLAAIEAVRRRDARLVCAHAKRTKLHDFATAGSLYRPGQGRAWLTALVGSLVKTAPDLAGVPGGAAFLAYARAIDVAAACAVAGVEEEAIGRAAAQVAAGTRVVFVVGSSLIAGDAAADAMRLVVGAMALAGAAGREGCGVLYALDRNNAQGVLDAGVRPGSGGLGTPEILAACGGSVRGLVTVGIDVVGSFPGSAESAAALDRLPFLVAVSAFEDETSRRAHVILPGVTAAERDGTTTSAERRVLRVRPAHAPRGEARSETAILRALADRLGVPLPGSPDELLAAVYPGLCRADLDPWGKIVPPGGEATLAEATLALEVPESPVVAEPADPAHPFRLLVGAELYHSGFLTMRSAGPTAVRRTARVLVHPDDATALGVGEGDAVRIEADGTSGRVIAAPVHVTEEVPPGTVFAPVHYPNLPALSLAGAGGWARVAMKRA